MGKILKTSPRHKTVTDSLPASIDVAPANAGGKRDDIIREAYKVFYREGFHAAGVERVLEGTGISKRTLYKYFESKEELIEATIGFYGLQQARSLEAFFAEMPAKTSIDKALSIFDWISELVQEGHAFGCYAMNAKMEYTQKDPRIEAACEMHFANFEKLFINLCRECKAKNVRKTACQLRTIVQGAITMAHSTGSALPAQNAKAIAQLLLENAC